jgi:hypothetical protein
LFAEGLAPEQDNGVVVNQNGKPRPFVLLLAHMKHASNMLETMLETIGAI